MSKKSEYQKRAEAKILELEKQAERLTNEAAALQRRSDAMDEEVEGVRAQIALLRSLDGPEAELDVPDDEPHD